jgi:hypothetical protein
MDADFYAMIVYCQDGTSFNLLDRRVRTVPHCDFVTAYYNLSDPTWRAIKDGKPIEGRFEQPPISISVTPLVPPCHRKGIPKISKSTS